MLLPFLYHLLQTLLGRVPENVGGISVPAYTVEGSAVAAYTVGGRTFISPEG